MIGIIITIILGILGLSFMWVKETKEQKKRALYLEKRRLSIEKWSGLTLKLVPKLKSFNGRFDRTQDILVYINGLLAVQSYDYSVKPTEISFPKLFLRGDDIICIIQLSENTRRDIVLNEETYKKLVIIGDRKVLEI